jgi:hypothetical protein
MEGGNRQSHVDYCSSIVNKANEGDMDNFQLLQNRAMRIILKKEDIKSYTTEALLLQIAKIQENINVKHQLVRGFGII